MKKLSLYVFLVLMCCNITLAQSSLPECEGNDKNISKFSGKHFLLVKKWTNCHGTGIGPKGGKYVGEFYKGKFHGQGIFTKDGRKYVPNYNHLKPGINDPLKLAVELLHLSTAIGAQTIMCRKDAFESVGGFETDMLIGEVLSFAFKMVIQHNVSPHRV